MRPATEPGARARSIPLRCFRRQQRGSGTARIGERMVRRETTKSLLLRAHHVRFVTSSTTGAAERGSSAEPPSCEGIAWCSVQ